MAKQRCPALWLWLELLAACGVGNCDSLLSAKWKPWMAFLRSAWRTYNLLFVCCGHAQEHFPVEGAVWKCYLEHWLV